MHIRKENKLNWNTSFISGLSPIKENHYLEGSVQPSYVDDYREIAAVTGNSVHDHAVIPEGIALPRLMLSLAHNGKVAWDVKWRPSDAFDSKAKYHLGYLAVLLGNGSLEVYGFYPLLQFSFTDLNIC